MRERWLELTGARGQLARRRGSPRQARRTAWQAAGPNKCNSNHPHTMLKRLVDIAGAATGLAITAPVMAASAAAVGLTMGRPIFFRQTRPGKDGEPFELIKFRTMRPPADGEERIGNDEGRITSVGRFLRSTSIDELPTLWNVLRGDMSLVGPRPLLMRYLDRYTPEQARRHRVRPGITGLAQVSGRNELVWDEKFRLDTRYVDQQSLWLDLRILARTVTKVLMRDGISSVGHATAPEFMGPRNRHPDAERPRRATPN